MTEQELQTVVESVLSAINTSSKTILQLTAVTSAGANDWIELSGGRRISFARLTEIVSAAVDLSEVEEGIAANVLNSLSVTEGQGGITLTIKQEGRNAVTVTIPYVDDETGGFISAEQYAALPKWDDAYNAFVKKTTELNNTYPEDANIVILERIDGEFTGTQLTGTAWYNGTQLKVVNFDGEVVQMGVDKNRLYYDKTTQRIYRCNDNYRLVPITSSINIVNDLTTGGEDAALSAEQGKRLAQMIAGSGGGFEVADYDDTSLTLTILAGAGGGPAMEKAATPTITKTAVAGGWQIAITTTEANGVIKYTLNDGEEQTYADAFTVTDYGTTTIRAHVEADGKLNSNTATMSVTVEAPPQTATPSIAYANNADGTGVVVTVTNNDEDDADLTVMFDGDEVELDSNNQFTAWKTFESQGSKTVTATATASGKQASQAANQIIVLPAVEIGDNDYAGTCLTNSIALDDATVWGEQGNYYFKATKSSNTMTGVNWDSADAENLTSVVHLPATIYTINESAFDGFTALKSFRIISSSSWNGGIGKYAFRGCTSLERIAIASASIKSVNSQAFIGCGMLTDVTIDPAVTEFVYEDGVFYKTADGTAMSAIDRETIVVREGCMTAVATAQDSGLCFQFVNVSSLTLPSTLTEMAHRLLGGVQSIRTVTCKAVTPPTGKDVWTFNNTYAFDLYVPSGSETAYATDWGINASRIHAIEEE